MRVLCVSFYSDIWVHSLPESLVASTLKEGGHEILRITCSGGFSGYCHAMAARGRSFGLPVDVANSICRSCTKARDALSGTFGFLDMSFEDYVAAAERQEAQDTSRRLSSQELQDLVVDGLKVGTYPLYEAILSYKKVSTELTSSELEAYRLGVYQTLISHIAAKRFIEKERPDRILVFSPQYSANRVWAEVGVQHKIPVYFMESATNIAERLKTLRVWKFNDYGIINPSVSHFRSYDSRNFERWELELVSRHFSALIDSIDYNVYSPKKRGDFSLRKHFKVPSGVKVIVAAMSSYDEAYAAYCVGLFPKEKMFSSVFSTQLDWIRALISEVKTMKDVFLIIRVHPRDFSNRRESVVSEQAKLLMTELKNLPSNVTVNWPDEKISIYDLAEEVDVVTTGWSVTGVEMALLGIPVVLYDRALPTYPLDLVYAGESPPEYVRNVRLALEEGWSARRSLMALRWMAINFSKNVVRMPKALRWVGVSKPSFMLKVLRGVLRRLARGESINRRLDLWVARNVREDLSKFLHLIESGKGSFHDLQNSSVKSEEYSVDASSVERRELRKIFETFCRRANPAAKNVKEMKRWWTEVKN